VLKPVHWDDAPVTGFFATATIVVSLVIAAWAFVHLVIARPMSRWLHASQLVLAAMFLVLAVGGIVQMLGSDREFARLEFVGYLLLSPLIPIGSWWWTRGDTTRIGSAIVMVVGLVMPVLVIRIQQIWAGVPVG
jgi:hypothetical protein